LASSLVIAEHDNSNISLGTLSTVTAASQIGGDISVLVIGKGVDAAAKHAATIKGVSKVLVLDNDIFSHLLAEDQSNAVTQIAKNFSHILAPSTANGKNYIPRTAALLNSSPLSDVLAVIDADTFKRPMYAGNAISTVKMSSANKV
jgi:electron transfer flavoprotein alpha subunit